MEDLGCVYATFGLETFRIRTQCIITGDGLIGTHGGAVAISLHLSGVIRLDDSSTYPMAGLAGRARMRNGRMRTPLRQSVLTRTVRGGA